MGCMYVPTTSGLGLGLGLIFRFRVSKSVTVCIYICAHHMIFSIHENVASSHILFPRLDRQSTHSRRFPPFFSSLGTVIAGCLDQRLMFRGLL